MERDGLRDLRQTQREGREETYGDGDRREAQAGEGSRKRVCNDSRKDRGGGDSQPGWIEDLIQKSPPHPF